MSEDNSSVSIIDRSPPSSSFPPVYPRSGQRSLLFSTLTTSEVVDVRKEVVTGETEVGKTTKSRKQINFLLYSVHFTFIHTISHDVYKLTNRPGYDLDESRMSDAQLQKTYNKLHDLLSPTNRHRTSSEIHDSLKRIRRIVLTEGIP
jgi:hypothetical protein